MSQVMPAVDLSAAAQEAKARLDAQVKALKLDGLLGRSRCSSSELMEGL